MNKQQTYAALEARMLTYEDIVDIPVAADDEPLVALQPTENLVAHQLRAEMLPVTGQAIYVRRTVAEKLGQAATALAEQGLRLQVGYGYRALSIQTANFIAQRDRLRGSVPDDQLDAAAHRSIAIPTIAGHPAGAAVDVRPLRGDQPVDCGTPIWTFAPDSYTFSPYITARARRNRMRLRGAMIGAGFAPFDGEWWHYSYGDKEWAAYYGQPAARYRQVEFSTRQQI